MAEVTKKTNLKKTRRLFFRTLFVVLFFGSIAAFLYWALRERPIQVESAQVSSAPFAKYIREEGRTRVKETFSVRSPVTGQLRRVIVEAGDVVQAGELLATIDWPRPREVRSPLAASVLKVSRESEGPIQRGDVLMELADLREIEVIAEVLTADAVQLIPGNKARIVEWGGCAPLEARLRLVEPQAFEKVSALGIEERRVNVVFDVVSALDSCGNLGDGYYLQCEIELFSTPRAIQVPLGALLRQDEQWYVYVIQDRRAHLKKIDVTHRNFSAAMVSGITKGERVILYPSDVITEGVLVEEKQSSTK